MKEIWTKGLKIPRFPQLDGDTSTEILVIGGGMAGVLCAPGAAVPGGRVSFGGGQNRGERHHQWNDGSAQHPS